MLRASNIPPLLSQITGDGIHTALLVTSDGELLGSVTTRQDSSYDDNLTGIGSLIAEVTTEYKRAGKDLTLLRGKNTTENAPTGSSGIISSIAAPSAASVRGNVNLIAASNSRTANSGGKPATGGLGVSSPLKCLIVEFEQGIAGVASTGSNTDCLVIALAESNVEVGLIRARLKTLASYVGEALTQLAEPP